MKKIIFLPFNTLLLQVMDQRTRALFKAYFWRTFTQALQAVLIENGILTVRSRPLKENI